MEERNSWWRRATGFLAVIALVAAACSPAGGTASPAESSGASTPPASAGGSPSASGSGATGSFVCENIGGEVSVYGTWTGAEQDSFLAMVAPWEECSGATINYTGQRDLGTALTAGIAGGNLPDVAGLPGTRA